MALARADAVRRLKIDRVVRYTDFGVSPGMRLTAARLHRSTVPVTDTRLPPELLRHVYGMSAASTLPPVYRSLLVDVWVRAP